MATIINNPDRGNGDNGGGFGMIIGAIVLIVLIAVFFIYGLPAIRNGNKGTTVNVPSKVDVNVKTPSTNAY